MCWADEGCLLLQRWPVRHSNSDILSDFAVVFDKMTRCDTVIKVFTLADAALVLLLDEKEFVS
jgi:hypothetical protein